MQPFLWLGKDVMGYVICSFSVHTHSVTVYVP